MLNDDADDRVLVFAPVGRDAELTRNLLDRAAIACALCPTIWTVIEALVESGAAALLLTEEALDDRDFPALATALDQQPPWSDVPVLLFAGGPGVEMSARVIRSIETLRNVTLLERPIRLAAVLSTVRSALRSRKRQYEVRDLLVALHRARAEAESANRLKDEFLATLSHELRTPLNAILGWTSMLARGQIEPGRLPRVFEVLDRNAQSQARLIAEVLDVSRIVTGKLQLQLTTVDLGEVVARACDAIRPAVDAKAIRLTIETVPGCFVNGDPERLQQVFWNLLSNGIKFTPTGGSVAVEVRREGDSVFVSVIDSGVGIPHEFTPFVFDRFRQADQTTTRSYGGLGLGLSIVKHLTELHGGTVTAASPGRGYGARFDVRLPAATATMARGSTTPAATTTAGIDLSGYAILVVDDDDSNREVVATALEAACAVVVQADSAASARHRFEEQPPALIVADIGMPVEDGLSLIRDVRGRLGIAVPAIALSAYADQSTRDAALAAGFTAFLAKPARADDLLALVASLLTDSGPRPARTDHEMDSSRVSPR